MSRRQDNKLATLKRALASGDFARARRLIAPTRAGRPRHGEAEAPALSLPEAIEALAGRRSEQGAWIVRCGPGDADACPALSAAQRQYALVMRGARQRLDELDASPALCCVADARPEDLLFVAAEQATGPAADAPDTGPLLIGVMFHEAGRLAFEQYLGVDEPGRRDACRRFAQRYSRAGVVVTFSGRRSQMKLLERCCAAAGADLSTEAWQVPAVRTRAGHMPHLDLRKECRRRWAARGRPCTLPALERSLLKRGRPALIPRSTVPKAFEHFAATANAATIADIFRHNALDLLAMSQLLCLLLAAWDEIAGQED